MSQGTDIRIQARCARCGRTLDQIWSIRKLCAYCKALPILRQALAGGETDD